MTRISRRQFLAAAGLSTAGALAGACAFPQLELLAQSPARLPEDLVAGTDAWYATLCRECPAGCGIQVRVVEGRAVKVEGNPLYPVNQGKLCARGQAAVQRLYHPDRILRPQKAMGGRGSGQHQEIGWDEALRDLAQRLARLRGEGKAGSVLLATGPLQGHQALVAQRFAAAYGARHLAFASLEDTTLRAAWKDATGGEALPDFALDEADFILSFGADFLGTWLSPVRFSRAYGRFRGEGRRSLLAQVEPHLSLTGANADWWLPVRPGAEGVLALSLAQVMVEEGLGDKAAASALAAALGEGGLARFRPEPAAAATGVPGADIRALARAFAGSPRPLALGGGPAGAHTNGLFNLKAIYALNALVGSRGLRPNPGGAGLGLPGVGASPLAQWRELARGLISGTGQPVEVMLVCGADPRHGLPASLEFPRALDKIPFIVSFNSFWDDTTAQADLILPTPAPLEEWGSQVPDPGPGFATLGLQQPVVRPRGDTRSFAALLLALGQDLGLKDSLPWASFAEMIQADVMSLAGRGGSVRAPAGAAYWHGALQQGGWWQEEPAAPASLSLSRLEVDPQPAYSGDQRDYPFHLIPFPGQALYDGRGAPLPWLQATPDPLTTVAWQTWVEVNEARGRELGLEEGDMVLVESPHGRLEAPVYLHPLNPPEVVAIPLGQGHADSGRYAQGRGVNVMSILAPLTDGATGALAWAATRVRLTPTGKKVPLPKFEGLMPARQLPGHELVRVQRL
ncbi:MAG: molybdopterin-dependent oxidoreductase [Chloroflexi bacterium]|nr:molybdopterin-dependent oxidoreductase [Chloroflexota bacterium]